MEVIPLAIAIKYGTPMFSLIVLVLAVYLVVKVRDILESVKDIRSGMVWMDVYKDRKEVVDRRLDRLEGKVFNGGAQ